MIAKLIKTEVNYLLKNEESVIIASTSLKKEGLALSLKNCQAIECGYDLDELVEKYCTHEPRNSQEIREVRLIKIAFNDGFQKALEILGDKKFSEEQLRTAYNVGYTDGKDDATFYNRFIQSLQQTEWDVIIVMECDGIETGLCNENCTCNVFPKLDADGCLILKRK